MERRIDPGSDRDCASCGERIKFRAARKAFQVICNVYLDGKWDRVEHYHQECYERAGHPYGTAA